MATHLQCQPANVFNNVCYDTAAGHFLRGLPQQVTGFQHVHESCEVKRLFVHFVAHASVHQLRNFQQLQ